jgi:hypothetical protein
MILLCCLGSGKPSSETWLENPSTEEVWENEKSWWFMVDVPQLFP